MKLVAIDLDGTLLSPGQEIMNEDIQAIQKAQSLGHMVMICSGRAPEDIMRILDKYEISCPLAGSNGTIVHAAGKIIESVSMNREEAGKVAAILDREQIPYRIYTNQGIYVPGDWTARVTKGLQGDCTPMKDISPEAFKRMTEQPKDSDLIKFFQDIHDLLSRQELTVQKFFILTLNATTKNQLNASLGKIPGIVITSSGPYNLEIMDKNGNKGNALRAVAAFYGIPQEDTVAIGDNFNDIPMLKSAGLSIAMGNADPHVKEICDRITLSNMDNGVAYAIEQYILGADRGI